MAPPMLKLLIRQERVQDPHVAVFPPRRKPLLPLQVVVVVVVQKAAARLESLARAKNRYRWRRPPPA